MILPSGLTSSSGNPSGASVAPPISISESPSFMLMEPESPSLPMSTSTSPPPSSAAFSTAFSATFSATFSPQPIRSNSPPRAMNTTTRPNNEKPAMPTIPSLPFGSLIMPLLRFGHGQLLLPTCSTSFPPHHRAVIAAAIDKHYCSASLTLTAKPRVEKGLRNEMDFLLHNAPMGYDIGGVAGHEQDLDMWIQRLQSGGQIGTVHLRHDHVGDDQMDLLTPRFRLLQGFGGTTCSQHS